MTTIAPPRRGRHRSEVADQAILTATLDVLASDGYGGLTMAGVIARSGVSSATLYRRWPTKQDLVAAALASISPQIAEIDTGSLRGDLDALVASISDALSAPKENFAEDVATELRRNPDFRAAVNDKFLRPRLEVFEHIVQRARSRGELGGGLNPTVAYSFVSGPLHHRTAVLGLPLTPAFRRAVVVGALAALEALAPAG